MSSKAITFKLVVEKNRKDTGDIRRVTLSCPVKYDILVESIKELLQVEDYKIRYIDDDGDRILLSSQYELDTAIGVSASKNVVRIFVEILKEKVQEEPAAEVPHEVPVVKAEAPKTEEKKEEIKVEAPKAEEKKEEIKVEAPKAEEKKAEEAPSEEPKAEEKKPESDPFAEAFAAFRQIPGVKLSHDGKGTHVVDVDFSKLFSPESCASVSEALSSAMKKMAEAAVAVKTDATASMKVDENAGVYSHVLHTLPDSVVHYRVQCDGCGKNPICGMRYKCATCDDYDLCQDCIRRAGEIHDPTHLFYPIPRSFPMGKCQFPPFGRPFFPHQCHCRPHRFDFQPQVQPEAVPEPVPKTAPETVPEPEKPEEPKKDELLDEKYASLHMTPAEMVAVHTLIDMGFPNVELDLCNLRAQNGVINDVLIDTLVRCTV